MKEATTERNDEHADGPLFLCSQEVEDRKTIKQTLFMSGTIFTEPNDDPRTSRKIKDFPRVTPSLSRTTDEFHLNESRVLCACSAESIYFEDNWLPSQ